MPGALQLEALAQMLTVAITTLPGQKGMVTHALSHTVRFRKEVLPGKTLILETEVISWKLLEQHDKKIIIYNLDNYWDPLIQMYENAKTMQFGTKNLQNVCEHVNNFENFKKIFSE